jgi:putative addiction module component (TIGR02574 family)
MSAAQIVEEFRRLSPEEQQEVVETILDEFTDTDDDLTPEQVAELDRRAEEALKHPERCKPLEQAFAEIEANLRRQE